MVLINCSPKTAKKTAASDPPPVNATSDQLAPATIPQVAQVDPVTAVDEPLTAANNMTIPRITDMGDDQQLAIYKDMAPLRIEMGRKIYLQNCSKCHEFHPPASKMDVEWVHIMKSMGPKAKLKDDQYMMVAAYLVNNAKK